MVLVPALENTGTSEVNQISSVSLAVTACWNVHLANVWRDFKRSSGDCSDIVVNCLRPRRGSLSPMSDTFIKYLITFPESRKQLQLSYWLLWSDSRIISVHHISCAAARSSDGTSQLCFGSSLFSLWCVRSSPSCLRACLQAWNSLRCSNGQICAAEAPTAPHEDLIVSRLIFLAAQSFWVILGFQKGRKSRWFLRSPWTVDYARVALISWGTWPWRGTLMWCPCRGYLWHKNEFNCRRLMTIMLCVWFFTAVCPHVGTEHHHTAKSLKITTNSLNADITQPHVHDKYNTNLLFSLLDKEHHADCSTGTKEFRFSLPGTNSK